MMINADIVNKEYIKTHIFKNTRLKEVIDDDAIQTSMRLNNIYGIPKTPEQKMRELRKKCADIINLKLDNNYKRVEAECGIATNTMHKYLNGTRNITREAVAKICVGAGLTLDEADKLFTLYGSRLDIENNLLDAIIVDNIKCKEGIGVFYEECQKYGIDIF